MEKYNWLINQQHVRGEIGACKELINSEIARSNGKNEYIFFKQVFKRDIYLKIKCACF